MGRARETRYYDGSYEEQKINSGAVTSIHYVTGGDGLSAMLITENGVTIPYYTYSDYLGSILTVTNAAGTVVATQNFDAWGRHRNPTNWNQHGNFGLTQTWLYRGFTGHEMLPNFALINMNGRMYDPILGRMISPDNYVATPYGTQGYNRYTYALNNPLKFTDPDGNNPLIVIPILIGAFVKGMQYDMSGQGTFLGGFWRGAAVGAATAYLGGIGGGSFLANVAWGAGEGILANGLSNALDGEAFFSDAGKAAIIGGAFAAVTSGIESLKNAADHDGFGTNIGRFKKLVNEASKSKFPGVVNKEGAQKVSTFWNKRFGGPKVKFSYLGDGHGNAWTDLSGEIDIPYADLKLGAKFNLATISHETAHFYKTGMWITENGIKYFVANPKTVVNTNIIATHGTVGYYDAIRNAGRYHSGFSTLIDKAGNTQWRNTAWRSYGWQKWIYQLPKRFF